MPGAAVLGSPAFWPDERAVLVDRIAEALRGAGEVWLLTGPRGSGRTTLLNGAIAELPGPPTRMVRITADAGQVGLSLREFVAQVAGLGSQASDALERTFELLTGDEPIVLVIDGADGLAPGVLRYIQLACKSAPGLQLFLVALPDFRAVLDQAEFAYLRSRLGPELVIPRLSDQAATRYVQHRFGLARTSSAQVVEGPALDAIVRAGQGLPGRLDQLLDETLALGIGRGERLPTPTSVRRAAEATDHPNPAPRPDRQPAEAHPVAASRQAGVTSPPVAVPDPPARLAPPRPVSRQWAGTLAAVALLAAGGLGTWVVLTPQRTADASAKPSLPWAEQAPSAVASAPIPAGPTQEEARPTASAPVPQPVPPELAAALLARGEAMLAVGDVSAARLLFERAAAGGGARVLRAAGRAYDPAVLSQLGAIGIRPDAVRAAAYYSKAAALGDAEAQRLLALLKAGEARR